MENYQIIKAYLETLPKEMNVSAVLENINKAEESKKESTNKTLEEMKEKVGKSFYYEMKDDGIPTVKFFCKITDAKVINTHPLYVVTIIEISDDHVYYTPNMAFTPEDIKDVKPLDNSIFEEIEKKHKELFNYNI